ncbi:hypothetical protein K2O51_01610 [Cupriavidus pinatubonensis]|uniref:hypothetical protein n=1 Tax=Cupriavidus pinatubonensis TaxID=248026 RepID=UPI0015E3E3B1|nr:hypothetical protein [Cupriavidus pinatubonensis]QYY28948.1 hypothetical protein K2O51_01610 [Cupriavidus pinatubonensis]
MKSLLCRDLVESGGERGDSMPLADNARLVIEAKCRVSLLIDVSEFFYRLITNAD